MEVSTETSPEVNTGNICYLVPVYNNKDGLKRTIESIESDEQFRSKVLVCDDGSIEPLNVRALDTTMQVEIIRKDKNQGISAALNTLLDAAETRGYQYAALIDAGDLHRRGRIEKQMAAFASMPNAVVIGGDMRIVGLGGEDEGQFRPPISIPELRRSFRRGYPFAHPTAMFKVAVLKKLGLKYDESIVASVDYDFLYRLHRIDDAFVRNIPDVLVDYIREPGSIGIARSARQAKEAYKIRIRNSRLSDPDSLIGLLDIRLILRSISPRLFYSLSKAYKRIKRD